MRIIHTADWHLGQTFYGFERATEHRTFLSWLRGLIKERKTNLLLIAGDVFDNPNPSAEAQRMLYDFLTSIVKENPTLQVVITAGNHDSAARLEAPNPLFKSFNIHVSGVVHYINGAIDYERMIIPITDDVCCLAVPYLRHNDHPAADSYSEGVAKMYNELYNRAKEKYSTIIAMGHLQASGAEVSVGDSSEHAIIGGMDGIDYAFINDGIAYTALGHLHKAQRVARKENVRYSGAPLPMSFAERKNRQSVTEVVIENGKTTIEKIAFETPVKLLSIPEQPQPIDDVLQLLSTLPQGCVNCNSPFLEIKVLVTALDPTLRTQIEEALKDKAVRLARIEAVSTHQPGEKRVVTYEDFKNISPCELLKDLYKIKSGEDMPDDFIDLLNDVIEEVTK